MTADSVRIVEGLQPGAIGTITALHGAYYAQNWTFGTVFEAKVARELAGFATRQQDNDLVLLGLKGPEVVASLILDLHDPESGARGAHLRWFIVAPGTSGTGLGRAMMIRAMAHVDAHANGRAWLTTFAGLHSARHLYERFGFVLTQEEAGDAWGTRVREQEFRRAPVPAS